MRRNKVGVGFMVAVLALAGIGVSYAGFSESLTVYGTVDTATVTLDIMDEWYSGTWVYKIWGDSPPNQMPPLIADPHGDLVYDWDKEILIYRGFENLVPTENDVETWATNNGIEAELEAWSYAEDGTTHTDIDADIDFVYGDIFPCIDFCADFIVHYTGSIPAKIDDSLIIETLNEYSLIDDTMDVEGWLAKLYNDYTWSQPGDFGIGIIVQKVDPIKDASGVITGWQNPTIINPLGYQLHYCDYIWVKVIIHLPQADEWEGLHGEFHTTVGVTQWYDPCID